MKPDEPDRPDRMPSVSGPSPGPAGLSVPPDVEGYEIVRVLGEGGMGIVYLARQEQPIQRQVALKVIKAGMDSKQVIARFEAEEQALALLDHPNVAQVYDAGTTKDGHPYFSMEYVSGPPITEYCDRQKLGIEERLRLFIQVCEGVQHAHQKGIIHRDIKPSNILVSVGDGRPLPKIIDFGVAKALTVSLTERTLFTETGQLLGTPEYMSPEQAELIGHDVDARSDIYSLGVLLYELLTGLLPFERTVLKQAGFTEILRIIREEDPPRPSARLSGLGAEGKYVAARRRTSLNLLPRRVRGDLDWIVMKSLEKDPTRRYDTANELAVDVERHLKSEPVHAGPPRRVYRLKRWLRKHRTQTIAAVWVPIATLLAITVTMTLHPDELDLLSKRIENDPKNEKNYIERAKFYFRSGKPERGFDDLERAAGLIKDSRDVSWVYGDMAWFVLYGPMRSRNSEVGVQLAQKALQTDQGSLFLNTLAMAQYRTGQWNDAVRTLQESMTRRWGGNGHTYLLLSMAEYQRGNKDAAGASFRRAVEWITNADWGVFDNPGIPYLRDLYLEASELMRVKPKAFYRKGPLTGEAIRTVTVRLADNGSTNAPVSSIVDGSGLGDGDYDGLQEHSESPENMWCIRKAGIKDGIEFDLGAVCSLGTILVWNYNERDRTRRGIGRADISVWSQDVGWQRIRDDFEFTEAEGSFDYDEPVMIELEAAKARKVRLDDLVNLGDVEFIGLSEIQFFERREQASRPRPVNGGTLGLADDLRLDWIPGEDATSHNVYLGADPCNLRFLGSTEESRFRSLPSLEKRKWYYWRVDSQRQDGSVIEGKIWAFSTGHLVARYSCDEAEDGMTPDSSGSNLHGRLVGDARIVSDPARGSVLSLDGDGDYVDCGNDDRFNITDEMTLAVWIKPNRLDEGYIAVITKSDLSWRLEKEPGSRMVVFDCVFLPKAENRPVSHKKKLDDGRWHHLACTYDGANMCFYVDANQEDSLKVSRKITVTTWKVLIGENAMWSGREWNGWIDDVRIYSYALTAREVRELYESTKRGGAE